MSIRVLLCDDHPIIRDGVRTLLQSNPGFEIVGEAEDGTQAVEMTKELTPDVVVIDMSLPTLNGALATKQIKDACPNAKVVAFTVHHDKSYLRQFLDAGASGYILKKSDSSILMQAIRSVALGERYIDTNMNQSAPQDFIRWPRATSSAGGAPLSEREEQVVQLLSRGFTNKEIAAQLEVSVKTVETYKSRALEKLDLRSRAELVRYAMQKGWLTETSQA